MLHLLFFLGLGNICEVGDETGIDGRFGGQGWAGKPVEANRVMGRGWEAFRRLGIEYELNANISGLNSIDERRLPAVGGYLISGWACGKMRERAPLLVQRSKANTEA